MTTTVLQSSCVIKGKEKMNRMRVGVAPYSTNKLQREDEQNEGGSGALLH